MSASAVAVGGPATCDGEQHYPLDTFAICRLVINGEEWSSAEQYFQAAKFADVDYRACIRAVRPRRMGPKLSASSHGQQVWQMGQSQDHTRVEGFKALETMYVANRLKFEQDLECRKALLHTRGPIEAAPHEGDLQLWNGRILERVREELRPLAERDTEKLEALVAEFMRREDYSETSAQVAIETSRVAFGAHQRRIVATLLDGKAIDLFMHPKDTAQMMREQLSFHLGIAPMRLKLIFGPRVLEDQDTVEDAELVEGSSVSVVISSPVPPDVQEMKQALHEALLGLGAAVAVP